MKALWLRARVFVHATEDEERVRDALLWMLGLDQDPKGAGRIDRRRLKGHYGNPIVILETSLRPAGLVSAALARCLGTVAVRRAVRGALDRHLDDDHVLHARFHKQAAVERRVELAEGSDAIVVTVKASPAPGVSPLRTWTRFLEEPAHAAA